ncbi:Serine/threonine-protein kinase pkn3 [Minicystis rosea]|nr:Serine/threonine-protein kinase pkn3 [Minicystis rosea]
MLGGLGRAWNNPGHVAPRASICADKSGLFAMTVPIAPGDVLAGKYRVERILGKGGMGMVVAAMHLSLEKRVALKLLLPELMQTPELVARFAREAKAASRIEGEHVAKVLDTGHFENGVPFMVMEYLEGSDLAQLIKQRGALPPADAIEYVLQACEAIAEAHVAGIVHRDLKPANLFLTRRADGSPCVKVLDFGISKIALASDQGQGMTQTSAMMGSPNYMAPEQLKSARNVDARTDIWSLGIILQELLTGEVAFKADTVPELYISILQAPPIPLRSRRPDAPPAMEAVIMRCLEKEPARRFASVSELAQALAEFAPPRSRLSIDRITRIVGAAKPAAGPAAPAYVAPASGPAVSIAAQSPAYASGPAAPGTPAPSYRPGPPAPGYPGGVSHVGGATPPGAYGPGGYGAPAGYPAGAPPYAAAPAPKPQGISPPVIALIAILAMLGLGFGSCVMCVCVGAASDPGTTKRHSALEPLPEGREASAAGVLTARLVWPPAAPHVGMSMLGPFQRPAGWTTVSPGAGSRFPLGPHAAWDAARGARVVLVRRGRGARAGHDRAGLSDFTDVAWGSAS